MIRLAMASSGRITAMALVFLVAAVLQASIAAALITAEKVSFAAHVDSDLGQADPPVQLSGVLYKPFPFNDAGQYSAVVLMHGCSGIWSSGTVDKIRTASTIYAAPGKAPDLQAQIEKWGIKLANENIVALVVDSFTKRKTLRTDWVAATSSNWQNQCSTTPPSPANPLAGSVDPYTQRVLDLRAAFAYLEGLGAGATINSAKIASLGWSQGAQATMVEAAVTPRDSESDRTAPTRFIRNVSIYPGCGANLGFGPRTPYTSGTVANSFWRPLQPMHLHVGKADPFHADCKKRYEVAAIDVYTSTVTFGQYDGAKHGYDDEGGEAWPTAECPIPGETPTADSCAMRSTDIRALAFLKAAFA